jgi:hypothetical protein
VKQLLIEALGLLIVAALFAALISAIIIGHATP